jgi:superfamily I DNA/RNA helicase
MSDQVLSSDFLDMVAFYLSISSIDQVISGMEADPTSQTGVDLVRLQKHRKDGDALLRRIATSVDAGIDSIIRDAADKSKLRVKTRIDAALRGAAYASYESRTAFLGSFLPRLAAHSNVLRDVFGTDSSQAIRIVQAAEIGDPLPRLFKLAGLRMASGGKFALLKRWTQEATSYCGNPVSEIEEVAVDVVTADRIIDQVAKNSRKLDFLDPTDPAAAAATQENQELLERVSRVAEKSKDPATVKAHAATKLSLVGANGGFATKISAHLGMTPEQEDAMLVRGKAVIAAGAGSGKTRVLAGKVIHHAQDLGLGMSNIMAMSFTKDSAEELKERIVKYAGEIGFTIPDIDTLPGIGTTHSIGTAILKSSGRGYKLPGNPNGDPITGGELSSLMKVAIAQVKMSMKSGLAPMPPKEAMSFFPNLAPSARQVGESDASTPTGPTEPSVESQSPVQNPVEAKSPLDYYLQDGTRFKSLITASIDTINDFLLTIPKIKISKTSKTGIYANVIEVFGPGIDNFWDILSDLKIDGRRLMFKDADPTWRSPRRFVGFSATPFVQESATAQLREAVGADKAENAVRALTQFNTMDPAAMSDNEKGILEGIITHPLVADGLTRRNVLVKTAADKDDSGDGIETARKRKLRSLDYDKSIYYYWLHNAAGQWFNIGATEDDFTTEDKDGEKKPIPVGEFIRFTSFNKNSLKAPGAVFMESQVLDTGVGEDDEEKLEASPKVFSAVYGAYEWLKGNINEMKGRLDFDDMLIAPSRELIESPALLAKYQKQYKCVLVDEAQDLNAAQHLLFGLVAGYIDAQTLKPRASGKMSADTFALIGDDKQAIYEFRAANPMEFISKSDLVPGGAGFATKLLDTNFRSGSAIVEAANKIITFNPKQIPMVCKSDPAKGEGKIQRIPVQDPDDAAEMMTSDIEADFKEADATGSTAKFYSRYGLAVRTNKEVYGFAMKMIEKGIPFRSKRNFLSGPAIGPIIGLFTVLRTDNVEARNKGVIDGVRAPDFGINQKTLRDKMDDLGITDYYDFLVNKDGARKVYKMREMVAKLQDYADYLEEVTKLGEDGSASDLINLIVNKKGPDGDTLIDSLAASLLDDSEAMSEIQMKADADGDGKITPDMMADYAMAPIAPLMNAAKRFPKAIQFTNYINSLVEANKPNVRPKKGEPKPKDRPDAVQIGTVHGWKGLEVDNLYIPMWNGGFPHARSMKDDKLMESERRLAYVAITRGRARVTVLEPKMVGDKLVTPSVFMSEACIPLMGTTTTDVVEAVDPEQTQPMKEARFADYLKTASVSEFLPPVSGTTGWGWGAAPEDAASEELEAQWGELMAQEEGN